MLDVEGMRAVNWNAPDPAATERFYTEIMGGKVVMRNQVRGHDVARVQVGNVIIGIFDASDGPCSGVPHHTLRMAWPADQDATCKQLEAAGVPVQGTRDHHNEVGFSIFVNDPIGNRLELSFDPPDLPPG
jgi:catechol 2,3-dioxygenase-like lactoylglutathione lyase family enzyme